MPYVQPHLVDETLEKYVLHLGRVRYRGVSRHVIIDQLMEVLDELWNSLYL